MTPQQHRIVASWEKHELEHSDIGAQRLVSLVTAETGADADTIVGALLAQLEADGGERRGHA